MLLKLINADIPVLLWGAPGTGKTAAITALAKSRQIHLEILIGSTMDPTDLGRPYITKTGIKVAPPPWAERIRKAIDNKKETWLMLDELTCAPPSIQAVLLRVVQERKVAELDLNGVRIIGAANPPEQAADPTDLSAATVNRWCHINWNLNSEEWIAGELAGWGKPDIYSDQAKALVTGWISQSPSALLDPPKEGVSIKGWPSPRSWSAVSKFLSTIDSIELIKTKEVREVLNGLIGPGSTTEFLAWIADNDLPNGLDLLNGKASLPVRGDRTSLALSMAISTAISTDRMKDLFMLLTKTRKDICLINAKRAAKAAQKANIKIPDSPALQKILDSIVDIG